MTTLRPTVDAAARAAIAARTEALFRSSGALRDGHFQLKSGRHSDAYLEKFLVLQDPAATSELCGFWSTTYRDRDGHPMVDLVAGPTTGGGTRAGRAGRRPRRPARSRSRRVQPTTAAILRCRAPARP